MKALLTNRYVLSVAAVVLTYFLLEIVQINHFLRTVLRGENYYRYYVLYLATLLILVLLYSAKFKSHQSAWRSVFVGLGGGYLAGLVASVILAFWMGGGLERITNSTRDLEGVLVLLGGPFIYMSWLYGALVMLSVHFGARQWRGI